MGDAGSASAIFDRAIRNRNAIAALSAAADLPVVGLDDALRLVLLLREKGHPSFQRAAGRWVERFAADTPGLTLDELGVVIDALRCEALQPRLRGVFRARELGRLEQAL